MKIETFNKVLHLLLQLLKVFFFFNQKKSLAGFAEKNFFPLKKYFPLHFHQIQINAT